MCSPCYAWQGVALGQPRSGGASFCRIVEKEGCEECLQVPSPRAACRRARGPRGKLVSQGPPRARGGAVERALERRSLGARGVCARTRAWVCLGVWSGLGFCGLVKEGTVKMALRPDHSVTVSPLRTVVGLQACPPSSPGSAPWLTSAAGPCPGSGRLGRSEPHLQLGGLISPSLMNRCWGRHPWLRGGISLLAGGSLGASGIAVQLRHAELLG